MNPFNYQPCESALPTNPRATAKELRSLLLEHEGEITDRVRQEHQDGGEIVDAAIAQLAESRWIIDPQVLVLLARAVDPAQGSVRFVSIAQLIRAGQMHQAERLILEGLESATSPTERSRYYANLALIHEIYGEGTRARRFALESVSCQLVSPLAILNYKLYCIRRVAG